MLKHLAILVVLACGLLAYAEKPLPVNGGQQQDHPQNHPNAPQPAAPQLCTSDVCKENAENAERYAYYKAHPKEYLKAAIAPANLSNWILVGLGGIAGLLAVLTLLVIKRQVDMFISKERGRLTVELGPFEFAERGEMQTVNLIVANRGSTNAFIISAKCLVCIKPAQWDTKDVSIEHQMRMPKVIAPNSKGEDVLEWVDSGKRPIRDFDQETHESLRSYKVGMFAIGYIEFGDVFDDHWRLNFCRRWGGWYSMGDWLSAGDWPDYGPPEANGECKIKKPSKWKRFWSWMRNLRTKHGKGQNQPPQPPKPN